MAPGHHDHDSHTGQKSPLRTQRSALKLSESSPELASSTNATQPYEVEGFPGAVSPEALMNVQRIQGNRATTDLITRMIQRQTAKAAPAKPAPKPPTQVSINKSDGPYSWPAKYQVRFTDSECLLNVKVKLAAQAKVTSADLKQIRAQTNREFRRIFDNKFKLTDKKTKKAYYLRVAISFVSSGEHVTIAVHPGKGHDDLSNWYVKSAAIDRAHEMGHQIGLKDEYIDSDVPARKDEKAPGVFKDNSIMGNYYDEGIAKAHAKLRHGRVLAQDIGSKTGHTFTASMNRWPNGWK